MKNKILILMVVSCLLFMNTLKVFAAEVGISDVNSKFLEYIEDSNYNISNADGKITISLTNPTYGPYTIEFNETDDTITYVNTRDISSANDETRMYYASTDNYFIMAMILSLFDVYNVDMDSMPQDVDYDAMGIDLKEGEQITYETSNGSKSSASEIESATFNLAEFDNYTKYFQTDVDNSEEITQIFTFLKGFSDPMAKSILSSSIVDEFTNGLNDMADDFSLEFDDSNVTAANTTQTVRVPSTAANAQYIVFGIFALAVVIGIGVYGFLLKRARNV